MRKYNFASTEKFGAFLASQYEYYKENADDFYGVSIVAHYNSAILILNWLIKNTYFSMCNIQLEEPDIEGYNDEWIVAIDPDAKIWVQKAKGANGYIYEDTNIVFVHSDANSAFVVKNKRSNLVEFEIGESDEKQNNLDAEETFNIVKELERSMEHLDSMFNHTSTQREWSFYDLFWR